MPLTLHIGTYDKNGGQGLVPVALHDDGSMIAGKPYGGARNASFGARQGDLVYLVDEQDAGAIGVHRWEGGRWHRLAHRPSGGAAPCYLALNSGGDRLAVANYASGSAALWAIDAERLPAAVPAMLQDSGRGPNSERQQGPHMHCVRFVGERVYLVDLGTDRLLSAELTDDGFGEVRVAWTAPAGAGPRHFVPVGSERAVVICELAATLTLLAAEGADFTARCTVPTAPASFTGENAGGHLAVNAAGTRVYASNRGHDSIAVFALVGDTLRLLQHIPSGGRHPRHFALLEESARLVAAHENDGRVTAFAIAPEGTLVRAGDGITVPGACFVLA